jgi:AmiR/NasT family two-component response regulator
MAAETGVLVAFIDDLMFLSRIRDAAHAAGFDVRSVREPQALVETCRVTRPAVVFVDLDSQRLPSIDAVNAVRAEPELLALPIVGFLGHTQTDLAQAARNAGCTRVLTRGAFVNELRTLILESSAIGRSQS